MKMLISFLTVLLLAMGLACSANAASYGIEWTGSVWLDASNTSGTWSFCLDTDILDVGDISAGDTITSATLEINFYDDDDELMGGPPYFGATAEFADITIDGTLALDDREIETETLTLDVLGYVSEDHSLDIALVWLDKMPNSTPWPGASMSGDFEVQSVKLSGEYSAVPVPAAVWLLGSGMLGLIGVRRKKR